MKRILVLRGGALGDFIVTLPALRFLRNRWSLAQIELVGNALAAVLGKIAGVLDLAHSQAEARWSQLYGSAPLAPDFQSWLDDFDLVVSFWPDPDGSLRRHFSHRGATFIASDAANITTRPAAAHFCAALQSLGLATETDYSFRLSFGEATHAETVRRLAVLKNFVAVHPGSGSPRKNWPQSRWTELVNRLQRPLLVITGETEQNLSGWPTNKPVVHAHDWPLPVLGAAMAKSALFIGHDSGISHLAAAAGAHCVLLFGPTDSAVWAPPGARVIKVGESVDTISVDEVLAAIAASPGPATADRR